MKLTLREKIEAIIVGLFVIAAVIALVHRDGEKKGAANQELKTNAAQVKDLRLAAVVVRKQSETKKAEYHAARAKVELKGDTVVANGKSIELPSVASLIKVADARGAQDSASLAKQDLLIASLDHRVDLLQKAKQPWCGRKCGIAVGAVGTVAVVYVAVRIIRAVGHK